MWRKPVVWIALVILALGGALVAGANFDRAFPVASLELDVDRDAALAAARQRAEAEGWATAAYRQAASFGLRDSQVQTYVELEGGGADGWQSILEDDPYRPYVWSVRQFQEGETREALVRLAPDGTPVGFRIRVPEDEAGAAITPDSGRVIAEAGAPDWGVDLARYTLVESSDEQRPNGRVDHTYVYERDGGPRYGEARTRLRLVVSGDRLTELSHVVEVPEAFSRRYAEMRSTNDLIAIIASLAFGIIYFGGGCGVALLLLLRAGWVEWRVAVRWALIIGALTFVASLNELPLAWMRYDTAVPTGTFLVQRVLMAVGGFLGMAVLLSLAFMAAETLDRKAFPGHVRLWRSWDADTARSDTQLGHTLGGYVFTGFFVAYVVAFYLVVARGLGWWTPAEAIVQPDLLATPFPWVSGFTTSLYAGFSEEALFRAVPLAGAAILGTHFGRRKAWIGVALVLQALIFAAAHANYPQQPAYARLVELFLPALALGAVYLRFGLLTGVIAHFSYDLTWFSVPLFASQGAWASKFLVVALGLVPLGIVLVARFRHGRLAEAPEGAYNRAWRPAPAEQEAAADVSGEADVVLTGGMGGEAAGAADDVAGGDARESDSGPAPAAPAAHVAPPRWLGAPVLAGVGLVGLLLWIVFVKVRTDAPELALDRGEAVAVADSLMVAGGVEIGDDWTVVSDVYGAPSAAHRFVWQTAGPPQYRILLGDNLPGPRWQVRWVRFQGPVEERAEEYLVEVGPEARDTRFRHTLPEGRELPSLEEPEARRLAERALLITYGMPPETVREVSAEANQLPNRMDWTFTFRTPALARLPEGEPRASVHIAGDQITDVRQFVYVPETWQREDRGRQTLRTTLQIVGGGLLLVLGIAAVVLAAIRWSRGAFHRNAFMWTTLAVFVVFLVRMAGRWPSAKAAFLTTQPYDMQRFTAIIGIILGAAVTGAILGMLGGFGHAGEERERHAARAMPVGIAAGFLVAGIAALLSRLQPKTGPSWPDFAGAGAVYPGLDGALGVLTSFLGMTILALATVAAMRIAEGGRRRWVPPLLALPVGLGMAGAGAPHTVVAWLVGGVLIALAVWGVYTLTRRVGPAMVPPFMALLAALSAIVAALQHAYPGIQAGALAGAVVVVGVGAVWSRWLGLEPVDERVGVEA